MNLAAPPTVVPDLILSTLFSGELPMNEPIEVGLKLFSRSPAWEGVREDAPGFKSVHDLDFAAGWVPVTVGLQPTVAGLPGDLHMNIHLDDTSVQFTLSGFFRHEGGERVATVQGRSGWVVTQRGSKKQDIVTMAVVYVKGVYQGVRDPILYVSQEGLPINNVIRVGSVYGMDTTESSMEDFFKAPGLPYLFPLTSTPTAMVRVDLTPSTNNRVVSSTTLVGNVLSVTTTTPHGYGIGDYVIIKPLVGEPYGLLKVIGASSPNSFQVAWDGPYELELTPTDNRVYRRNPSFRATGITTWTAVPPWQSPTAVHTWFAPQRMNLLANPSFENDTFGWTAGSVGTGDIVFEAIEGGVGVSPSRTHCGYATTNGPGRIAVESNKFPAVGQWYSVSLKASGVGDIRVGTLSWDATGEVCTYVRTDPRPLTYQSPTTDQFGNATVETKQITSASPDGPWDYIRVLVPVVSGTTQMALRIEFEGEELYLDDCLVDPNPSQYDYFDGNSNDGLPGDFRWHGGLENEQFSLWYNNWHNTKARLFGDFDTVDGVYKTGKLEDWLPDLADVVPHWDAFDGYTPDNWEGDYFYPIVNNSDSPITDVDTELDVTLNPFGNYLLTETGASINTELPDMLEVEVSATPILLYTEDGLLLNLEQFGLTGSPLTI